MGTLHELIQSAHKIVRESVDGRPVDYIALNQPVEYRKKNERTIEVTAGFDGTSQNLQKVEVTLLDEKVDNTFTQEELASLVGFIDKPFHLIFYGSNIEERFDLKLAHIWWVKAGKFRSEYESDKKEITLLPTEDGSYTALNYDQLGKFFGLDLKDKDKSHFLKASSGTDSLRIPEAYQWAFCREFSPTLHLLGKGKVLHLHGIHNYDGSLTNRFTIGDGVKDSDTKYIAMAPKQVDAIEAEIREYRGTDLSQIPFNVHRFDVVTGELDVPTLRTAVTKSWDIGDGIYNVIQWATRSPKSESMYPNLQIAQ